MVGRASRTVTALFGVTTLALAGCGPPEGVDGDLVGGWAALPEPVLMVPEAGVCHPTQYEPTARLGTYYVPVACTERHVFETAYVGTFAGEAAERRTPPAPGTSQWHDAYRECDQEAAGYLGADFRYGQLWLGVAVPTVQAWQAGARWFRCDVVQTGNAHRRTIQPESIRGALSGPSELRLGCATVTELVGDVLRTDPVDCAEPHEAEFVGVWHSDQSLRPDGVRWLRVHRACRELVAEYVGVPVDPDLPLRTGTYAEPGSDEDWDNGDRGIRCYLWLDGAELTESLAGAGEAGLPIQ